MDSLGLWLAQVEVQVGALDRPLALLAFFLRKEGRKLRGRRNGRHRGWRRKLEASIYYCWRSMQPAWHRQASDR